MMKLSQALAAIIFGTSIPTIYSIDISGSAFGHAGFKSYHSNPSTIQSFSEPNLLQSRRRAELTLSQECIDGTKNIRFEDIRYNTTVAPLESSCPMRDARDDNQDGTIAIVLDYGDCDDSEFLAFCDANYQTLKFPNVKVSCEPNFDDLNPAALVIYSVDVFDCVDPSCPSELSPEDVLKFLFLNDNSTGCIAEFLEEGEEPQVEVPDAIVPDNLSEECMVQIDVVSTLFASDEEYIKLISSRPDCAREAKHEWMSGNDTIIVFDDTHCEEGKEYSSKANAYCDAHPNYQHLFFGTMKATCPGLSGIGGAGTLFIYYTQFDKCVGMSCPANPADWSILDMIYTDNPGTIETSCELELIAEEDVPEPPETAAPAAEDDATTAAPEDEDSASGDDESSASRFVAGMTIALPLAAAYRLLV